MLPYRERSREALLQERAELEARFREVKAKGLKLNMSRGRPETKQLNISKDILDVLNSSSDLFSENGTDCMNYGVLDGLPEAKRLFAELLEVAPENVMIYGNASLTIMYDAISRSYTHGVMGSEPWCRLDKVKWLCPVPGYDRHFAITERFGAEMILIPMTGKGPDMDLVEKYVQEDPAVKGIWCVPKYSNPGGEVYSDETVRRMAALEPAAPDFRIYWDNAYAWHYLYEDPARQDQILEILSECRKAGHPDMVYEFCSTSKITFPGGGVAAMASSEANLEEIRKQLSIQTIGHDKLNQLRHVRYFKNADGVKAHMMKHAAFMRPKFEAVEEVLEQELGGLEIGTWTKPNGGYFISFDALPGCAKRIVALAKEAGVTMTAAGASYPCGKDPEDKNIRIAPTYPSTEDLAAAADIFVTSVKIASIDKILETLS